ncbi:MAG: hypothetical protein J2P26_04275 [Nocardiopsaceae bacterium]|nr:hypothetical protein [Nocardiopsaceae bacterium]
MRWQDVPMPPGVAARPREPGTGRPVPWIAEWSSGDLAITSDPERGLVADCACVIGDGEPTLGELCDKRQKLSMRRLICQVCGTRIPEGAPAHWFGHAEIAAYREPPACLPCAIYGARVCPELLARRKGGEQLAVHVSYGRPRLLEERMPPGGETSADAVVVPPEIGPFVGVLAMYRAVPQDGERLLVADWLPRQDDRRHGQRRAGEVAG